MPPKNEISTEKQQNAPSFFDTKIEFLNSIAGTTEYQPRLEKVDLFLAKPYLNAWTAKEYGTIQQDLRALRYLDHEKTLNNAQESLLFWMYIESEVLRHYYIALDPNQNELTPRAKKQAKQSQKILGKLSLSNEELEHLIDRVKAIKEKEKEKKGFFAAFKEFFSHSSNIRTSLDTANGIRLLLRFWSLTITAMILAAEKVSFLTTAAVNAVVVNRTFNIASVSLYAFRFIEEVSVATANIYRAYEAGIDPYDQLVIELKQRGEYFLNDGPTGWGWFNWTNFEFVRKGLGINDIKVHGSALVDVLMGAYLFYDLIVLTGFWWIKRQDSLQHKAGLIEFIEKEKTWYETKKKSTEGASDQDKKKMDDFLVENSKAIFEIDIDITRNDETRIASAKAAVLLILGFGYVLAGGALALPIGFLVCTFATHCYAMSNKDAEIATLTYIEEEQKRRRLELYDAKTIKTRRQTEEDKIFMTRVDNLVVAPALMLVAAVTGLWPVSLVAGILYGLYRGGVFDKEPPKPVSTDVDSVKAFSEEEMKTLRSTLENHRQSSVLEQGSYASAM